MNRIRLTDRTAAVAAATPELKAKLTTKFHELYKVISETALKDIISKEGFTEWLNPDLESFFNPKDNFETLLKWYTGTGSYELLEKEMKKHKDTLLKTLNLTIGNWLKENKAEISSILEGKAKNASIAERLDAIATEIEKEDPRIALAIDQITDRIVKTSE